MKDGEVLAELRAEVAELRERAAAEADPARRADRLRLADAREAVIVEEAEAISAEINDAKQRLHAPRPDVATERDQTRADGYRRLRAVHDADAERELRTARCRQIADWADE